MFKSCITNLTVIWHNVSMYHCMTFKKALLIKRFVTQFTFKFDLLMNNSVPFEILRMLIAHCTASIKTLKKFPRDMFMFVLFKFTSEPKLIITVLTFIYLWFLTVRVKSPGTQSVNHFLTFLALVRNVAVIDMMMSVKGLHSMKCNVR